MIISTHRMSIRTGKSSNSATTAESSRRRRSRLFHSHAKPHRPRAYLRPTSHHAGPRFIAALSSEDPPRTAGEAPRSGATADGNGIEAFPVEVEVDSGWGDTKIVIAPPRRRCRSFGLRRPASSGSRQRRSRPRCCGRPWRRWWRLDIRPLAVYLQWVINTQ